MWLMWILQTCACLPTPPHGASYEYYTDDGETKDYNKPEHFLCISRWMRMETQRAIVLRSKVER